MGALACLAQVIGQGKNSVLYQQLVKKQLALQANGIQPIIRNWPVNSVFHIVPDARQITGRDGHSVPQCTGFF